MDVVVRAAEVEDADDIGRVHVLAWQEGYRGQLPDDYLDQLSVTDRQEVWRRRFEEGTVECTMFVAEDPVDGHVCGWVGVGHLRPEGASDLGPGTGQLWALNLEPAAWGRGIATALMAGAVEELVRMGYDAAVLWVLHTNRRARRFYEREGWVDQGVEMVDPHDGLALRERRYGRTLSGVASE